MDSQEEQPAVSKGIPVYCFVPQTGIDNLYVEFHLVAFIDVTATTRLFHLPLDKDRGDRSVIVTRALVQRMWEETESDSKDWAREQQRLEFQNEPYHYRDSDIWRGRISKGLQLPLKHQDRVAASNDLRTYCNGSVDSDPPWTSLRPAADADMASNINSPLDEPECETYFKSDRMCAIMTTAEVESAGRYETKQNLRIDSNLGLRRMVAVKRTSCVVWWSPSCTYGDTSLRKQGSYRAQKQRALVTFNIRRSCLLAGVTAANAASAHCQLYMNDDIPGRWQIANAGNNDNDLGGWMEGAPDGHHPKLSSEACIIGCVAFGALLVFMAKRTPHHRHQDKVFFGSVVLGGIGILIHMYLGSSLPSSLWKVMPIALLLGQLLNILIAKNSGLESGSDTQRVEHVTEKK